MRKRKTRKQKIKSAQRKKNNNQIRRDLMFKRVELEAKLAQSRRKAIKAFHVRNLKIFRDTCNFVLPFVVCTGLMVGTTTLLGFGLPIKQDDFKRPKLANLQIEAQGEYKSYDEEYVSYNPVFDSVKSSNLTLYSPWEQQEDGLYRRFKRVYNSLGPEEELISAILRNDYETVVSLLSNYDEEIQTVNMINEEPCYKIEGEIHFLNKNDYLTYTEKSGEDIVLTIVDAIIALAIGSLIAYKRDFSVQYAYERDCQDFRIECKAYKKDKEKLKELDEKILSLKNNGGRR